MYIKGFTWLEVMLVCALMGILVMLSVAVFKNVTIVQTLEKDTSLVVEVLREARSLTLASVDGTNYGVRIASDSVVLFSGSTYVAGNGSNKTYALNQQISLEASLAGGGSNVVFERLTGKTVHTGSITVWSTATTSTKTVTIHATGLIETN